MKGEDFLYTARQFLLIGGLAAAVMVVAAGCGSSSSSTGGDTGGATVSTEVLVDEVTMIAEDLGDLAFGLLEAVQDDDLDGVISPLAAGIGSGGNPVVSMTKMALSTVRNGDEVRSLNTEPCLTSGTVTITEGPEGLVVVYDNCVNSFEDFSSTTDGRLTVSEGGADKGYAASTFLTYENLRFGFSNAGDSFDLNTNGGIAVFYNPGTDRDGRVEVDLSYQLAGSCAGDEFSGSFGYDNMVMVVTPEGGVAFTATIDGGYALSFEGLSLAVTVATTQPLFYMNDGAYPNPGRIEVTIGADTIVIEYVEAGVLVDGEFISWEAIEAEVDDEDDDDIFDGCFF